jgi:hypothetical protein
VSLFEGFVFGLLGGVLREVLTLFRLRHQPIRLLPVWVKSPWYWATTALMLLSGGFLVVIYMRSNIAVAPILAVNIGASAPLILGSLVSQAPALPPGHAN